MYNIAVKLRDTEKLSCVVSTLIGMVLTCPVFWHTQSVQRIPRFVQITPDMGLDKVIYGVYSYYFTTRNDT